MEENKSLARLLPRRVKLIWIESLLKSSKKTRKTRSEILDLSMWGSLTKLERMSNLDCLFNFHKNFS